MNIIRWAAAAVTGLFVLMNLGAAIDPTQADWVRIASAALGIAGAVAAVGLASNRAWGRPAVIAVGALNVCDAAAALFTGEPGVVAGVVVGGLGVLLGVLAGTTPRANASAA